MDDARRDPIELITAIARTFPHWDRDELISAGLVGYAKALQAYDGRIPFDAYAALRVRHEIQDALRTWYPRSRRSRGQTPIRMERLEHDLPDQRDAESGLIATLAVRSSLKRLSPRLRKAVRLFYFAEYSHRQVAQALGCGPDRVAQLLRQAKHEIAALRGMADRAA